MLMHVNNNLIQGKNNPTKIERMQKSFVGLAFCLGLAHFSLKSQCFPDKGMEHAAYNAILKGFITFNNFQQLSDRKFNFNDYYHGGKLFALDTNEYIPIYFRCLSVDSTFMGLSLIEFNIDLSTRVKRHCDDVLLVVPSNLQRSDLMTKGLIGLDLTKKHLMVISGNMFLPDIGKQYFSNEIHAADMVNYVYYRYYNYSPKIYRVTKKYVFFASEYNEIKNGRVTSYLKKYKVKIWRSKGETHEKIREIKSAILDTFLY